MILLSAPSIYASAYQCCSRILKTQTKLSGLNKNYFYCKINLDRIFCRMTLIPWKFGQNFPFDEFSLKTMVVLCLGIASSITSI